jgi:hypothetical protein
MSSPGISEPHGSRLPEAFCRATASSGSVEPDVSSITDDKKASQSTSIDPQDDLAWPDEQDSQQGLVWQQELAIQQELSIQEELATEYELDSQQERTTQDGTSPKRQGAKRRSPSPEGQNSRGGKRLRGPHIGQGNLWGSRIIRAPVLSRAQRRGNEAPRRYGVGRGSSRHNDKVPETVFDSSRLFRDPAPATSPSTHHHNDSSAPRIRARSRGYGYVGRSRARGGSSLRKQSWNTSPAAGGVAQEALTRNDTAPTGARLTPALLGFDRARPCSDSEDDLMPFEDPALVTNALSQSPREGVSSTEPLKPVDDQQMIEAQPLPSAQPDGGHDVPPEAVEVLPPRAGRTRYH